MKLIILTMSLFYTFFLTAQSPPNGTIWHYNQYEFRGKTGKFFTYALTGDTTVNGFACKIMKGGFGCSTLPPQGEVLRYEGRKIFRFDKTLNTFNLLYDFAANTGDTLKIALQKGNNQLSPVRVDSIRDIQIGREKFRIQYLKQVGPPYTYAFGGEAVERAGCTFNFFPQYGACDPIQLGGLRCYQEAGKAFFKLVDYPCDSLLSTSTIDKNENNKIQLYPNPSLSAITIDLDETLDTPFSIEVSDMLGKRIFYKKYASEKTVRIDISPWQSGFYTLFYKDENERKGVKRFVKL